GGRRVGKRGQNLGQSIGRHEQFTRVQAFAPKKPTGLVVQQQAQGGGNVQPRRLLGRQVVEVIAQHAGHVGPSLRVEGRRCVGGAHSPASCFFSASASASARSRACIGDQGVPTTWASKNGAVALRSRPKLSRIRLK